MTVLWKESPHRWDGIRKSATTVKGDFSGGIHESIFRSYQVLAVVREMLARGDSVETISEFVAWIDAGAPWVEAKRL